LTAELAHSYAHCRAVARSRARNFYYSFVLLAGDQKNAMCAMYAFMRFCDDLSDESGANAAAIERWRKELGDALEGRFSANPIWPAFHDAVQRYAIPHEYFYDMIEGVRSDLDPRTIATFQELYRYCYNVASVVGMTTMHIFGFDSPDALKLAEKCGIAFQLTNILRDVREDAENGRVYIPAEDIKRFGADVRSYDERFVNLMRFQASRARAYYDESAPLIGMTHPRSRASLWALIEIYRRLLDRIETSNFRVLEQRISVPAWQKISIVLRAATWGGSLRAVPAPARSGRAKNPQHAGTLPHNHPEN
jgi:phytoene synthase